jgi:hypothetical protein
MRVASRTWARQIRAAFVLSAVACGTDAPPTLPPPPPATPTGTLLLYDPYGILYTADAATMATSEVSRFGDPVSGAFAALGPGGMVITGNGTQSGTLPRGLRLINLVPRRIETIALFDEGVAASTARVSPDGKILMFSGVGWVPGQHSLVRMDMTSRESEVLWIAAGTPSEQNFSRFKWLPDQSGLIGHLGGIGTVRIARFDLESRTVSPITPVTTTDSMLPSLDLSPDGKTIAYNTQSGDLTFITLAGTPAAGFPTHLRGLFPAFSPDGRLLAYSKAREDGPGIDGVWFYRFSDGATWRALPADSRLTWVVDWE